MMDNMKNIVIYSDDEQAFFCIGELNRFTRDINNAIRFESMEEAYEWLANNIPCCSVTMLEILG